MPANAFAVATTVSVVLGGPALFCVLIGKNPLPATDLAAQVAAEPALPVYVPAKPAPVVQEPAKEAQPVQVVNPSADEAQPVHVVSAGSAEETQPEQMVNAAPGDRSQPVQVTGRNSLLKRSPFDDFELRIPVPDEEPAPAPKRLATKSPPVAKQPARVQASSYWQPNARSPWNAIKAGARAYRPGMTSSAFGSGRFSTYGGYGSGQRFNPFTSRFTRVNQRSYYRKWYQ